jgi:hypothetical protein
MKVTHSNKGNHTTKEEITIVGMFAPNFSTTNFTKPTLLGLEAQIDPNTMMVRDFNTPLSSIDRSSRQQSIKKFQN